jgi:2,4-dienoyl-CoA reductase-like NADH-dependent reductase (Old Yellow Enzyme family)
MTTHEAEEMVECFVTAAVHAREAGSDGVEVHGAQGHLIGQFVSARPMLPCLACRWGALL